MKTPETFDLSTPKICEACGETIVSMTLGTDVKHPPTVRYQSDWIAWDNGEKDCGYITVECGLCGYVKFFRRKNRVTLDGELP